MQKTVDLEKFCFIIKKMTVTDQIKTLEKKIKQNEAQIDLDRLQTSNKLDNYEYLTGEYLNYKPGTAEQAKFDYSSLSKFFNRGFKEEDKKEEQKVIMKT